MFVVIGPHNMEISRKPYLLIQLLFAGSLYCFAFFAFSTKLFKVTENNINYFFLGNIDFFYHIPFDGLYTYRIGVIDVHNIK